MSEEPKPSRKAGTGEYHDMIPDSAALRPLATEGAAVRKGHPPGLFLLFIVEMWERFSYYGNRALLVLYLISAVNSSNPGRGWAEPPAYMVLAWYGSLVYLLPLLGGYIADKFLGTHRSMVIGGVMIAVGHIVLGVTGFGELNHSELGMSIFMGGLILIMIGTGYFKPCVSVMVGQLYRPGDPRRDGAFTIFYMGINVGAFVGTLICGFLGEWVGWHWGFGAAAVGMLLGLFIYLLFRPRYLSGVGLPPEGKGNTAPLFLVASLCLAAGVTAIYHLGFFVWLGDAFTRAMADPLVGTALRYGVPALIVGGTIWFIAVQKQGEKGPVTTIFLFMLFNAFFWLAFEQAATTLNVFALNSTDRGLFGIQIPASAFQSVNPLLIIAFAPLFAMMWTGLGRRNLDPSQPVKIGLGLLLLGAGYVFIVIGAQINEVTGVAVSMFWLVAMYTLHTLGELCLSPTGLSYVTKAAPVRFVSLLMGIWFISSFLAHLVGGLIATQVVLFERGELRTLGADWFGLQGRADFFFLFVISSFGAGLLILILVPLLKHIMPREEVEGTAYARDGKDEPIPQAAEPAR